MLRAVDKFRISALHSSRLTAAYESTPHSPLVARLDLHNFSSAPDYTFFNELIAVRRCYFSSDVILR
jgi:hypothetical protein